MIGESVTILPRVQTGTDRYNKPIYDWPGPGTVVAGCAVAPRSSTEPTEPARTAVITGVVVYAPTGTVVGPHDRLQVRGELFEVDGDPGDWRNPYTGNRPGIEINLKRVEG